MKTSSFKIVFENAIKADLPFAIIYRPHITGENFVEVIFGEIDKPSNLEKIILCNESKLLNKHDLTYDTLVVIPYKQIKERGFSYQDDDAELIAIKITQHFTLPKLELFTLIKAMPIKLLDKHFDLSTNEYAKVVQHIIESEIGCGSGSNFVIKRELSGKIPHYDIWTAMNIFRNLTIKELGAYWVFLIHIGQRTLLGASPELHVSLKNNTVMMNPISGTYCYPKTGPDHKGILNFINKTKEKEELLMVVEEVLKMLSPIIPQGGTVTGPFLREMSRLAHTEFTVRGRTDCDPRIILRQTLFSPAVTGSPIQNACRVIKKYEKKGRGYYAGVAALLGKDKFNQSIIDSTILIRTADIDHHGQVKIGVGSTIVRHSKPLGESKETKQKALALLDAMQYTQQEMGG